MNKSITLSQLAIYVKEGLKSSLLPSYWVIGEIKQLNIASTGHCYIELIEKNMVTGYTVAKMSAAIWKNTYNSIDNFFYKSTGSYLENGMKVLLNVEVSFHEVYGISLIIKDIDPNYTLGEAERIRRETILRLEKDGLIELNKQINEPRVYQRIAIISSSNAAGYGDFIKQLTSNPFGYYFDTTLFETTVQGDRAESSILSSLHAINSRHDDFDCVVIIRGGGSAHDLACFDSYEVAAAIARSKLRIITGIGHDRDVSVADLVAAQSIKTPTAVGAFIIDSMAQFDGELESYKEYIKSFIEEELSNLTDSLDIKQNRIKEIVTRYVHNNNMYIQKNEILLSSKIKELIKNKREEVWNIYNLIHKQSLEAIKYAYQDLDTTNERVKKECLNILSQKDRDIQLFKSQIDSFDPHRILSIGYSIARLEGKAIRSIDNISIGNNIDIDLTDGTLSATINKIKRL